MNSRALLLALLGWPSIGLPSTEVFSCPALKPAVQMAPPYAAATDGSRCEGFYQKDIAGPYLELLSLVDLASKSGPQDSVLRLQASTGSKHLVVLPLPQGVAYRADLAMATGSASWSPDRMLQATGLKLRHLGFLALAPSPDERLVLSPVFVGEGPRDGRSVALVRTSVPIKEVRWRVVGEASTAESSSWRTLADGNLEKWGLARIELGPVSQAGRWALVQIQARRSNGELLPVLEFKVLPQ